MFRKSSFFVLIGTLLFAFLLILLVFVFARFPQNPLFSSAAEQSVTSQRVTSAPTVILDAGHGGVDSGAVSILDTEEKHINLAVTKKLGEFLKEAGFQVLYTRTDDTLLTSSQTTSRKMGDLLGRVEFASSHPEGVFVSIHMNTLPDEKYKGLQVFYSPNASGSKVLANQIQNDAKILLQPENNRKTKEAGSSIYILERIRQDAVLVECGFLSNREEAERLEQEEYQRQLAFSLSRSLITYLMQKENLE